MTHYLSYLRLSRTPPIEALGALLAPDDAGARLDANHRLLWAAFANDPQAKRDFLWREIKRGQFITLSERPPEANALFEEPDVKRFAPELAIGDRLAFTLRANATKERPSATGDRRVDVVMDALHGVPKEDRAERRMKCAQDAGAAWIERQGARAGFGVETVSVSDYSVLELPIVTGRRCGRPRFGILEMGGVLTILDPGAFLAKTLTGFGRARAFGCGLMLLRRA